MIVQSLKYKLAAITATSLLSSCVGSSTPTTPPGFRQNQSQVEKRAASPCLCLYVTNTYPNNSVTVYASGATGNALPIRTIIGSNTGLNNPVDIAVGDGGKIYVANYGNGSSEIGSVTVYAAGATGNVAPIQTISGPNARVQGPDGIALDPVNKHIYVSNTDFGSSFSVTSTLHVRLATSCRVRPSKGITQGSLFRQVSHWIQVATSTFQMAIRRI